MHVKQTNKISVITKKQGSLLDLYLMYMHVPLSPSSIIWYRRTSWEGNAGPAESNGSLSPSGWLNVTCVLTACTQGSAPGPIRSEISMGKLYLYYLFSARCNIYISRLCYDVSVRLPVRLSVTEVHWRIIANLGFKFRSQFTAHCGRGACGREH